MKKVATVTLVLVALVSVGYAYGRVVKPKDLYANFLPAVRVVWRGGNPYTVQGFFNPPWVLIPYLPLAFLPDRVAASVWFAISLIAFGFIAYKSNLRKWAIWFLLSPPVVYSLALGNIDWLPLLGLFVPFPYNLLFYLSKPQIALGWILYELSRGGQWMAYVGTGAVVAFHVAFQVIGIGPGQSLHVNAAVQPAPIAVGVGVYVAILMLRKRDDVYAPFVGPLLSPYVNFANYVGVFLAMAGGWWIVAVDVVVWATILVAILF